MKRLLSLALFSVLGTIAVGQNQPVSGEPRDIVEHLWVDAAAGNLLTEAGLKRSFAHYAVTADYFAKPIDVVSGNWAIGPVKVDGNKVTVVVGFLDLGKLDSKLRFSDVPDDPCGSKDFAEHRLEAVQTYSYMYASDGKTLLEKRPSYFIWRLKDPLGWRWATVDATIRYALETRAKTTDPEIKRNADKTIAKLLRYH